VQRWFWPETDCRFVEVGPAGEAAEELVEDAARTLGNVFVVEQRAKLVEHVSPCCRGCSSLALITKQ